MGIVCEGNTEAMKQYRRGGMLVAGGLALTCAGLAMYVSHHTPTG